MVSGGQAEIILCAGMEPFAVVTMKNNQPGSQSYKSQER